MKVPTETKVYAGTAGAGAGFIVSQFILWLLGCWAWGASWSAAKSLDAVSAVPGQVAAMIGLIVTAAGAWIAGRRAPHTSRPDLHPEELTLDETVERREAGHYAHPADVGLDDIMRTAPIEPVEA